MRFEEFLEQLPSFTRELTKDERDSVRRFLDLEPVRVALAQILLERSRIGIDLVMTDFSELNSDRSLYITAKSQGIAVGIHKAIGLLFELASADEEDEIPAEDSENA